MASPDTSVSVVEVFVLAAGFAVRSTTSVGVVARYATASGTSRSPSTAMAWSSQPVKTNPLFAVALSETFFPSAQRALPVTLPASAGSARPRMYGMREKRAVTSRSAVGLKETVAALFQSEPAPSNQPSNVQPGRAFAASFAVCPSRYGPEPLTEPPPEPSAHARTLWTGVAAPLSQTTSEISTRVSGSEPCVNTNESVCVVVAAAPGTAVAWTVHASPTCEWSRVSRTVLPSRIARVEGVASAGSPVKRTRKVSVPLPFAPESASVEDFPGSSAGASAWHCPFVPSASDAEPGPATHFPAPEVVALRFGFPIPSWRTA